MRSRRSFLIGLTGLGVGACSGVRVDDVAPTTTEVHATTTTTAPTTTTTEPTTTTTVDPAVELVSTMSLGTKIGQLLMPVLAGTSADSPTANEAARNRAVAGADTMAEAVAGLALGGVLYLGPNIGDAAQVTGLSADLQSAAAAAGLPPLLVAVDQEGGRVQRLSDGMTSVPAARSLTPDVDRARSAMSLLADEVTAQGINVVFAPVADLVPADEDRGVIGDRSYSGDPAVAAGMVSAAIQGLQGGGVVAASAKHWPGHGATTVDSHTSLPTIDVDEATWRARERVPFAAAVEVGVDLVMVGHLAFPALDPSGLPATESTILVDQLLRQDLGFDGVVVSDALDMGAVADRDPGELAVVSVLAGIDLLLASPDVASAHRALQSAVADGRLDEARIDASALRIVRLKRKLGLLG